MKTITVDKNALKEVLKLLGMKKLKCAFCGKRITVANYGLIAKDYVCCSNLCCLIKVIHKLEEKTKQKKRG